MYNPDSFIELNKVASEIEMITRVLNLNETSDEQRKILRSKLTTLNGQLISLKHQTKTSSTDLSKFEEKVVGNRKLLIKTTLKRKDS